MHCTLTSVASIAHRLIRRFHPDFKAFRSRIKRIAAYANPREPKTRPNGGSDEDMRIAGDKIIIALEQVLVDFAHLMSGSAGEFAELEIMVRKIAMAPSSDVDLAVENIGIEDDSAPAQTILHRLAAQGTVVCALRRLHCTIVLYVSMRVGMNFAPFAVQMIPRPSSGGDNLAGVSILQSTSVNIMNIAVPNADRVPDDAASDAGASSLYHVEESFRMRSPESEHEAEVQRKWEHEKSPWALWTVYNSVPLACRACC